MSNAVVDRGYSWCNRLVLHVASRNLDGVDRWIRFCNWLDT